MKYAAPVTTIFKKGDILMNRKIWNRVIATVLAVIIFLTGSIHPMSKVKAAEKQVVYISLEKFTIGQGYIAEPKPIEIAEGETVSNVLLRFLVKEGLEAISNNSIYGFYLAGIKNADTGNGHIPLCIQNMPDDEKMGTPPTDADLYPAGEKNLAYPDLCEFSYGSYAGWMYSVNNEFPGVGMSAWKAKAGDVIRIRFSVYGIGADLGDGYGDYAGILLPNLDAVTKRLAVFNENRNLCFNKGYQSTYQEAIEVVSNMDSTEEQIAKVYEALPTEEQIAEWVAEENQKAAQTATTQISSLPSTITLDRESQVVSARAIYDALTMDQKAYVSADTLKILTDAEAKIAQLKKEVAEQAAIEQAEKEAAEQKAADQAAANKVVTKIKAIGTVKLSKESKIISARKAYNVLTKMQQSYVTNYKTLTNAEKKLESLKKKKYTPKKTTLKSVKKSGSKKMKLTWKKVSGATGYQVYMSTKKKSGYKKVATIKKNKTVSYTKKSLKKGKTYYFKIRTYKKVGKTTYYGSYSNVKKLKMK